MTGPSAAAEAEYWHDGFMDIQPIRDARPLAVQVYDALYQVITEAGRTAGDTVPTELDLAQQLGVSRRIVRQALTLLEEDGLLSRGQGRRRVVAGLSQPRPDSGPTPIEDMFGHGQGASLTVSRRATTHATRWSGEHLDVPLGTPLRVWQSHLDLDGEPALDALELSHPDWAPIADTGSTSMLQAVDPAIRSQAHYSLVQTGYADSRLDPPPPGARVQGPGVLVLTVVLNHGARPVYLAKYIISARLTPIRLTRR
ncbi:GntR family transcriptional regulator [Pseudactinotalea sp. HY160]|nr:GntR family transcriptional regulator [Pseudactinotalea sp. HY160]